MSLVRRWLTVAAITTALLLFLEAALRLAVAPQVTVPHIRVYPQGYYTWDPGARFVHYNLPKVVPPQSKVRINKEGLRGAAVPALKDPGEKRILVLGDSFTAAVQLPEEKIFTTLLERELSRRRRQSYRVINAGFNGAGTAHELLYFIDRGIKLEPDLLVLQFTFNDIEDNLRHSGFRWDEGRLRLSERFANPPVWKGPLLALRDFLGNRSLAFYLCYKLLTQLLRDEPGGMTQARRGPEGVRTPALAPLVLKVAAGQGGPQRKNPKWGIALQLLTQLTRQMLSQANARGIPVVILVIPWPLHLPGPSPAYAHVKLQFRRLVRGSINRLVVMDPWFQEAIAQGRPVYLEHDGHLSGAGHELVASRLAQAIAKMPGPGVSLAR